MVIESMMTIENFPSGVGRSQAAKVGSEAMNDHSKISISLLHLCVVLILASVIGIC